MWTKFLFYSYWWNLWNWDDKTVYIKELPIKFWEVISAAVQMIYAVPMMVVIDLAGMDFSILKTIRAKNERHDRMLHRCLNDFLNEP